MFYIIRGGIKMEIGEFSKKAGFTVDTLRYYNKIGLLVPERINNRRHYTKEDMGKAIIITKLKNLSFSLDEILALFKLDDNVDETKVLDNESRKKVISCLDIIEEKYKQILKKEQDIIQIKLILEKMIKKADRLLETGCFIDNENDIHNGGDEL
jgi:DNA-binding transcriptional MerR regulator